MESHMQRTQWIIQLITLGFLVPYRCAQTWYFISLKSILKHISERYHNKENDISFAMTSNEFREAVSYIPRLGPINLAK